MSVRIFVPDLPEFSPIITAAGRLEGCATHGPRNGYWMIESADDIEFQRKPMGLGPALWNSALTGGFRGHIVTYGRDVLRIAGDTAG